MEGTKLEVGKIVNTRGIKGEVKIVPWCDDPSDFERFPSIWIKTPEGLCEYVVMSLKYTKGSVALGLEGVDTVEEARLLLGATVYAEREDFELEDGEYFIQDLIGLSVLLEDGTPLGTLADIFQTGSNDVYAVKTEDRGMVYLPCIKDVVKRVDLKEKTVTVRLLEGLLD